MTPQLITIDGVHYEASSVPQHVLHLLVALNEAQRGQATKQAELLVYNHAVSSISQQLRGAMSVIPPYMPEPEINEGPEEYDVHQD